MNRQPDPQAVRNLAYSLWEQRGKPDGDAERHWLEAERLLGAADGAKQPRKTPARPRARTAADGDPGAGAARRSAGKPKLGSRDAPGG